MKIAEALTESKRLSNLLPSIMSRFSDNCVTINGVKPDHDPMPVYQKLLGTIEEKAELDKRINATNAVVKLPCGLTICDAILRKASLKLLQGQLSTALNHLRANKRALYDDRKEGIVRAYAIKPEMLEAAFNEAGKELRMIEAQLQQTNWIEDLR